METVESHPHSRLRRLKSLSPHLHCYCSFRQKMPCLSEAPEMIHGRWCCGNRESQSQSTVEAGVGARMEETPRGGLAPDEASYRPLAYIHRSTTRSDEYIIESETRS